MFLFKHFDGIPNHPFNPDIKRGAFVQILRQQATVNENLEVESITGDAVLYIEVFHYKVDESDNIIYRYKGLDKVVEMKADNEETMTIPGVGEMPDFEAMSYLFNNKLVHIKDAFLGVIIDRFTPTEEGVLSKLDLKLGY
jgi:hypothetical protein